MSSLALHNLRPHQAMAASQLLRHRRLMLMLPRQKGGKTELGVRLAHDLTIRPTTTTSLFLAKSRIAGRKAVREKFLRLFDRRLFEVNTELVYLKEHPTSAIFIDSVDKDPDRIRGGTYHYIHWSEVAFSKFDHGQTVHDVFDKIINPTLSERNGYVLLESTPNGKNGWHDIWNDAAAFGFKTLKLSLSDLVYLGIVSPAEFEAIKSTTQPDVFDQEWEVKFITFQGKVYCELNPAKHFVKNMPGPEAWQTCLIGIDWGYHPGATCVLFAYVRDGALWIFDEHYAREELARHTGDKIIEKLAFWNIRNTSAVADHEPDRIEELNLRGIACSPADKVNVLGNRIQGKELFYYNKCFIDPVRCPNLARDLDAAVWHPKNADKGEIDADQCTWGHFDAEAAFRYLLRRFAELVEYRPVVVPNLNIDPASAAMFNEIMKRAA